MAVTTVVPQPAFASRIQDSMRSAEAIIAANRFGLGARPEEAAVIEQDPKGWLLSQIAGPRELSPALRDLPGSSARAAEMFITAQTGGAAGLQAYLRLNARAIYRQEAGARLSAAVLAQDPFRERLVAFWANHFTVSGVRGMVAPLAGSFEREVIRPHVTGRLGDMLVAACKHPAMLIYLDNVASTGPNSRVGVRADRGLNENLSREILDLHTIGTSVGYTQDDVRALARILTGWRLVPAAAEGSLGSFFFDTRRHEPGTQLLLDRKFPESGVAQGEAALQFLARHPLAAEHVALKLARHFVSDKPPPAFVARLAQRFLETSGDLGAVARALVEAPEPWTEIAPKIRTPLDFQLAALRSLEANFNPELLVSTLAELGQPMFRAPSPAGWPDRSRDWLSPEGMVKRIEWAVGLASQISVAEPPEAVLDRALGPAAGPATRAAVSQAESAQEAIALLYSSPEFQRR